MTAHQLLGNRSPETCSCRECGWARGAGEMYVSPRIYSDEVLAAMTLDSAESLFNQGRMTADEYEGYRHAWAISPAHEGYSLARGWTDTAGMSSRALAIAAGILAATYTHNTNTRGES